jgi:hypothetical protein
MMDTVGRAFEVASIAAVRGIRPATKRLLAESWQA